MTPLWRTREGLMPFGPEPRAVPHLWWWARLYPLAARSADLVPVGRGGERRAIGLGNPGLPGDPYATPTLWAAIQYLAPRENAPSTGTPSPRSGSSWKARRVDRRRRRPVAMRRATCCSPRAGTSTGVRVSCGATAVDVVVEDDGPGRSANGAAPPGYGLAGCGNGPPVRRNLHGR